MEEKNIKNGEAFLVYHSILCLIPNSDTIKEEIDVYRAIGFALKATDYHCHCEEHGGC